jgi:hypothetical protein
LELEKYHDMMNSASVIKGMAELLIDDEPEPEKKDMLYAIADRAVYVAEQLTRSKELEEQTI